MVVLGGSVALELRGMEAFQEVDQTAVMKPITKAAWQVPRTERIPAYISKAFQAAISGRPGPVYLDLPADVLYGRVEADTIQKDGAAVVSAQAPVGDPTAVRGAAGTTSRSPAAHHPLGERITLVGSGGAVAAFGGAVCRSPSIPRL